MATLRHLRQRIKSIKNTQQVTRAMEMVAASRLRKATQQLLAYRPYAEGMNKIFTRLTYLTATSAHPFLEKREVKNILAILITSSRGLCGSYNTNLIKTTDSFLSGRNIDEVKIMPIGKKGQRYYQKTKIKVAEGISDFDINFDRAKTSALWPKIEQLYLSKAADEVYVIYPNFISRMNYKPTVKKILPLETISEQNPVEYIVEPDKEGFLNAFLPLYLISQLGLFLFEALTSEYSARAMAMKIATDNADDLLSELTLQRNKLRQAAITKEILDIVTAAEAVK